MKKYLYKIMMLVVLVCFSPVAQAQTWDEWFSQGWAQHEYDRQQIYALYPLLFKVSDGLKIVGEGLSTVINITNGELNLHNDFFDHRKNVNPNINNAVDFIEVVYFQLGIVRQMNAVYDRCGKDLNFSPSELLYIERVHRNFLVLTEANISELLKILRTSDMAMSDDERMGQLDRVYDEMKDQRNFVNAFDNDTRLLSRQRQHEAREAQFLRSQNETY